MKIRVRVYIVDNVNNKPGDVLSKVNKKRMKNNVVEIKQWCGTPEPKGLITAPGAQKNFDSVNYVTESSKQS